MNPIHTLSRFSEPWYINEASHAAIFASVVQKLKSGDMGSVSTEKREPSNQAMQYTITENGVAVLNIGGVLALNATEEEKQEFGFVSMGEVESALDAITVDDRARALVLSFDSPGGTAIGTHELADSVSAFKSQKPVVAHAGTGAMMASAAYYVGSRADFVMADTTASAVGSIGTLISFFDYAGMLAAFGIKAEQITNEDSPVKGMFAFGVPLNAAQRAFLQEHVNSLAAEFKDSVTTARPSVSKEALNGGYWAGRKALSLGLIDQNGSLSDAIRAASSLASLRGK